MITHLPESFFEKDKLPVFRRFTKSAMNYVIMERLTNRYYSLMIRLLEPLDSYSAVVRIDSIGILRISLMNMKVHELYLFALGLPTDFPTEQIIAYGRGTQYIPCKGCTNSTHDCEDNKYSYELAVPVQTSKEVYRQRILKDLNEYFGLTVKVEKLTIVKDSRKLSTIDGESVELLWEEKPMMIIRTKRSLVAELSKYQVAERI